MFKLEDACIELFNQHKLHSLADIDITECWWVVCHPHYQVLHYHKAKKRFTRLKDDASFEFEFAQEKMTTLAAQQKISREDKGTGHDYRYFIPAVREDTQCLLVLESPTPFDKNHSKLNELSEDTDHICAELENIILRRKYVNERSYRLQQEQAARKEHEQLRQFHQCTDTFHQMAPVFIEAQGVQNVLTQGVKVLKQALVLNQAGIFLFTEQNNLLSELCIEESSGHLFYKKFVSPVPDDLDQFKDLIASKPDETIHLLTKSGYIDKFKFQKNNSVFILLKEHEFNLGFAILEYNQKVFLDNTYKDILFWLSDLIRTCLILKRSEAEAEDYAVNLKNVMTKRIDDYYQKIEALKKENITLSEQSLLDPLTGLANRRYLDKTSERELENAKRHEYPLTLMVIDVDYFKKYNDFYGHSQGDLCLKQVADVLVNSERRKGSFIARFGGEEFVILLVQQREKDAAVLAQTIQKNLEKASIEHQDSDIAKHLTVSIGYASTEQIKEYNWNLLFQHADQALYAAKHQGRNQALSYTQSLDVDDNFKKKHEETGT